MASDVQDRCCGSRLCAYVTGCEQEMACVGMDVGEPASLSLCAMDPDGVDCSAGPFPRLAGPMHSFDLISGVWVHVAGIHSTVAAEYDPEL